jgi:ATP-binding cassette, subfamily A (ABC1), member 3
VVTIILWLLTSVDFYKYLPTELKYFLCFLPNLALSLAINVISQFERSAIQFQFKDLYSNIYGDDLNVGIILTVMLTYSILCIPLIWYTEKVLPGEFGIPLPYYFLFQVIF